MRTFPAQLVIVTAFPELYFDEDVREREAMASFQRAFRALQADRLSAAVAVFTDATSFRSSRRVMFQELIGQADQVLKFTANESTGLSLTNEKFSTVSKALP